MAMPREKRGMRIERCFAYEPGFVNPKVYDTAP